MLRFNELRIDNLKNLIVDVSVNDILIDTYKVASINNIKIGIGSNSEYIIDRNGDYMKLHQDIYLLDLYNNAIRGLRFVLPLNTVESYNNNLIYCKIELDVSLIVTPIPCWINTSIEGYAYDKCLLYNKIFDYIKMTNNNCCDINAYANYITLIKGLELAVESDNFTLANKYWNKFFKGNNTISLTSNCNCNG